MDHMGAAAVCMNHEHKLLMVLQGKPEEQKTWSVPSGRKEPNESYEQCCVREVREETGYAVAVNQVVLTKLDGAIQYFEVTLLGGTAAICDPDDLIYEIAWKSHEEIQNLPLTYEEDRIFLLHYLFSRSA
jgi:ADP-ribose pyrophosphatase YjhB (NUDIX family)